MSESKTYTDTVDACFDEYVFYKSDYTACVQMNSSE